MSYLRAQRVLIATLAATFGISVFGTNAVAGDLHENQAIGYKIRLPENFSKGNQSFTSLADMLNQLSGYQVASFGCKKPLTGKTGNFYRRMTIYFFPERSLIDAAKEGKKGEIFLNFKDYATAKIRGFFFESEEEEKVAGFPAQVYEMKFEKLTGTPKRYMVCSYQATGGELAVVFTCTEEHFKKLRGEHIKSFKSFRLLSKEGLKSPEKAAKKEASKDTGKGGAKKDTPALPPLPTDLKERFAVMRDRAFDKAIADLEKGWKYEQSDHFLTVFNTSASVARKVERHAELLRAYMDDEFGAAGTGRVQDAILRVREGSGSISSRGTFGEGHVRTFQFRYNTKSKEVSMRNFSRDYVEAWITQRDGALWKMMPPWLKMGFAEVLSDARVKGSRLVFDMDVSEGNNLARLVDRSIEHKKSKASGTPPIVPFKTLMGPAAVEAMTNGGWNAMRQSTGLFRFLFDGPGAKNKRTELLLKHYIAHCADLASDQLKLVEERLEKLKELEEDKEGLTDEERLAREDALYKLKREQSGQNLIGDMMTKAYERSFSEWDDDDWAWLDKTWRSWAKRQGE